MSTPPRCGKCSFQSIQRFLLASLLFGLFASPASAIVLDISFEADGGVLGAIVLDVTIDNDFTSDIADTSDGLTINELTFESGVTGFAAPLLYSYQVATEAIVFGGAGDALFVDASDIDFALLLTDIFSTPAAGASFDTDGDGSVGTPTVTNISVSEVTAAIPLPMTGWLLLAGLGAIGAAARRRG